MSDLATGPSSNLGTIPMGATFNVRQRLEALRAWRVEWEREEGWLKERLDQLDENSPLYKQQAMQIASLRRRLSMKLVQSPIDLSPEGIQQTGYAQLRAHLAQQFAVLSREERLLWLNNFYFILTPDLRQLNDKMTKVRACRSLGQQRNFLLGGESGMGKTTYLNWYVSNHLPTVEANCNHVPIIKVDAPVSNRTPKPLFQRMILECGRAYLRRDNEEDLLMYLVLCLQKCGVEIIIVDEIQHIVLPELRRRLLEISNLVPGIPIVCASCHPLRWIEGDAEVAGRWNDYFGLAQYTGERLSALLSFIELLLPFTRDSYLYLHKIKPDTRPEEAAAGPAWLIEKLTGGILRDIMILITDASRRAIEQNLPRLSPALLEETWRDIQTRQVTDFLQILHLKER